VPASSATPLEELRGASFLLEHASMFIHVALTKAEGGWIVAECPALPELMVLRCL
jgi:hypothetical protein